MMAGDRERPLSPAGAGVASSYFDLARSVGLDPDGRVALADVSQEGSKEESGHSVVCTTSGIARPCPSRTTGNAA